MLFIEHYFAWICDITVYFNIILAKILLLQYISFQSVHIKTNQWYAYSKEYNTTKWTQLSQATCFCSTSPKYTNEREIIYTGDAWQTLWGNRMHQMLLSSQLRLGVFLRVLGSGYLRILKWTGTLISAEAHPKLQLLTVDLNLYLCNTVDKHLLYINGIVVWSLNLKSKTNSEKNSN